MTTHWLVSYSPSTRASLDTPADYRKILSSSKIKTCNAKNYHLPEAVHNPTTCHDMHHVL